jgi:hypothetical protein
MKYSTHAWLMFNGGLWFGLAISYFAKQENSPALILMVVLAVVYYNVLLWKGPK